MKKLTLLMAKTLVILTPEIKLNFFDLLAVKL